MWIWLKWAGGGVMHSAAQPSKPTAEAQRNPSTLRQFETHSSKSWRMNVLSACANNKETTPSTHNGHYEEMPFTSPLY